MKDRWELSRTSRRSPEPTLAQPARAGPALRRCRRRRGTRKPRRPSRQPIGPKPVSLSCPQFTPARCSWHRHGPGRCPGATAHGRLRQHPAMGEGPAPGSTDEPRRGRLCSAELRSARYSHVRLAQRRDQHPAGSARGPGETLTQQPGQGQDSPSCLFIYRASSQHQEHDSFFSSQAFHAHRISVLQPGRVSGRKNETKIKIEAFEMFSADPIYKW